MGSSPTSPQGALGSPTRDFSHKDQRRVGHIHAEQKRRYNIKNGFDVLHSLIPHLNQNPNAKVRIGPCEMWYVGDCWISVKQSSITAEGS